MEKQPISKGPQGLARRLCAISGQSGLERTWMARRAVGRYERGMATLITPALVCALRPHGEHGAIARLLTPGQGLLAGHVPGGSSRRVRPLLFPGHAVTAAFRARTEQEHAGLTIALEASRAHQLCNARGRQRRWRDGVILR